MIVIGITGGSGAGKTTVLAKLRSSFGENEVSVLHMDCYYKDNSHIPEDIRQSINFDHPDSLDFELMCDHLQQLKNNKPVQEPVYDFVTSTRQKAANTIVPSPVIIVEGILVFSHQRLVDLFDIKVFVDTDADERLLRIVERDVKERGKTIQSVITRYAVVKRMHDLFIEPSRQLANVIIPMNNENKVGIEILVSVVRQKLAVEKIS